MEKPSILLEKAGDGGFMRKQIRRILFLAALVGGVWLGGVMADARALREDIVRLHVVANSDSAEDQAVKLRVRDAVLENLRREMANVQDIGQAKEYIKGMLPKLTQIANQVLAQAGFDQTATVSLGVEEFPLREYDTFSLPSGLYQSLRIIIGDGQGQNWWCVVYPELCIPATSEEFVETASIQGMPDSLSGSLTGEYEIRFWILDQLGKLGNFLHGDSE